MKTKFIIRSRNILIILFALCLSLSIFCLFPKNMVSAENVEVNGVNLLPSSPLEYYELDRPIDCYHDSDNTIIINKNGVEIILYKNNQFTSKEYQYGAIAQVKKFGNDIFYLNQKKIHKLNTSTLEGVELQVFDGAQASTASGASFDCNNNYLVTISDTGLFIYEYIDNNFVLQDQLPITNEKIAVNNNNLFYISENFIVNRAFTEINEFPQKIVEIDAQRITENDTIVANDSSLFYTVNGKLFFVDLTKDSYSSIELQSPQSEFELGSFGTISGITLNGQTILVTDNTNNCIQEFAIEDNKLVFTGFAIAKNKTAYNRVANSVKEIEKQGNTIGILDNNKLSIVINNEQFDGKNKDCFINHFYSKNEKPTTFALGRNKFLAIYSDLNNTFSAEIFDINNSAQGQPVENVSNTFVDACYQSGYFYIMSRDGSDTTITQISETNSLDTKVYALLSNFSGELFTLDVFGNYYVYSQEKVYCNNADTPLVHFANITKLDSDLAGTVFALSNDKIYRLENNQFVDCNIKDSNIKSFALSFDTKDVYYIIENEEFVKKTTGLSNLSIDSIEIPHEFLITNVTADNNQFKVYNIKENLNNCNVYHVDYSAEKFSFNRLDQMQDEYAFICEVTVNSNLTLYALAGQTGIVLINSNQVEEKILNYNENLPENIFITTPVNCYYLPIIKSEFALSTENVRLNRGQSVNPIKLFTFLNVEFYYAQINDQTFAYIPKNFTTEVLSEDVKFDNFTLEKVYATNVYSSTTFSEENIITTLSDGQQIKLLSIEKGIAHVLIEVENGVIEGYIEASKIINEPNTAVRNILIALAVIACICGSISYFLLRKKEND